MSEFETPFWKCWAAGVPNCLYAWCCAPCANADIAAAAGIASDNWVFNCCCVSIAVSRMLYRKKGHKWNLRRGRLQCYVLST
eukprot:UN15117